MLCIVRDKPTMILTHCVTILLLEQNLDVMYWYWSHASRVNPIVPFINSQAHYCYCLHGHIAISLKISCWSQIVIIIKHWHSNLKAGLDDCDTVFPTTVSILQKSPQGPSPVLLRCLFRNAQMNFLTLQILSTSSATANCSHMIKNW